MNPWHARRAVDVLRRGGLVLHATEGVWGLACDPFSEPAVNRLLFCKGRAAAKGLIVIGAHIRCFAPELDHLDPRRRGAVCDSWPGAVTWIVPNRRFPAWITGGRATVAVRVPGHEQARALCRAFGGPLVSTSANRSGHPPARRSIQARRFASALVRAGLAERRHRLLYVLAGETGGRRGPSAVRTLDGVAVRPGT